MRNIKVAIAAVCVALAGHASADDWHGEDKKLHAIGGSVIALAMTAQTRNAWTGFKYGCGAGVAKEVFDATGQGEVSAKDLIVTCLGAAVGAGTGFVLVPGAVFYRIQF